MTEYEPPSTDPAKENYVASANMIEITEPIYHSAKLQNKLRWLLVIVVSFTGFFIPNTFINVQSAIAGNGMAFIAACVSGVLAYKYAGKLFPLADLTSTVKFQKFGNDLRVKKATERSKLK